MIARLKLCYLGLDCLFHFIAFRLTLKCWNSNADINLNLLNPTLQWGCLRLNTSAGQLRKKTQNIFKFIRIQEMSYCLFPMSYMQYLSDS